MNEIERLEDEKNVLAIRLSVVKQENEQLRAWLASVADYANQIEQAVKRIYDETR